ncbi:MAG: DUF99 family protein [Candidatus Bathyarchaeia archaeon]
MLKKEARILGISTTAHRNGTALVVGAVFRGRSWLDGVLTCWIESETARPLSKISRTIMSSRQYSQLHAVILAKEQIVSDLEINITELARRVKLPVISIIKKRAATKGSKKPFRTNHYELEVNGERLQVLAKGISREKTQELFALTSTPKSSIPEAARVADLIAEQVTLKWNSLGLP